MEITNSELRELDIRAAEFYKLNHRYLYNLMNLHGRSVYKTELSNILKIADSIKPESEFDNLVLRNIQSNLRLNDLTIDFLSDPHFSYSVPEFFNKAFGEGGYEFLEARVKSPPWKARWCNTKEDRERRSISVNRFTEEAQKAAREWIPRIKEDILKYGKREGFLPEDFDMTVLLLPPKDGSEHSCWNPATNIFSLGSYGFEFLHRNGCTIAMSTLAYLVGFHEVLGHGAHQIHSQHMPLSTRFTDEIGAVTPTKSITEGVAINAEKMSYNFLREHKDKLDIKDGDIERLELGHELMQQSRWENMYYHLLKDRKTREKGFDVYKHMIELTENPVLSQEISDWRGGGFGGAWEACGHTMGKLHYERMENKLKQEFGEEYLQRESKRFNSAALTGVWSWEIYPGAVSYILKNN